MNKPSLMILAAGMGSRYGGLKQLDPMGENGETIIDFSVYDAIRADFGKIIFVIRRDIEDVFREKIGSRFENRVQVEYAFQELDHLPDGYSLPPGREKPWGTSHAVMVAEDKINEPFAVINADDYYGVSAFQTLAEYLRDAKDAEDGTADYSMVGYVLRQTLSEHGHVSRGVCELNADGTLKNVRECLKIIKTEEGADYHDPDGNITPMSGSEPVSMNMWGFTPTYFDHIRQQFVEFLSDPANIENLKSEFLLPLSVADLVNQNKATVQVLSSADAWFGVTFPEDKPVVQASICKLIDGGIYPRNLWG